MNPPFMKLVSIFYKANSLRGFSMGVDNVCSRCVMDTTDSLITFDENHYCNHCRRGVRLLNALASKQTNRLELWAKSLKARTSTKKFDVIIGLSGGIDSSYVALLLQRLEIRPLVVHVDAGWNNEVAVTNIRKLVDALGFELQTVVIDWTQMRKLQTAFLRAGIKNQDIPQDHAFFSSLYEFAAKHGVRDVVTGSNISTESILPSSWGSDAMDGRFIRSVARSQGLSDLSKFPISRLPHHYFLRMAIGRMVIHKPLDMINYRKESAKQELQESFGWRDYGGKHRESMFTTWFQHSYLPRRFGIDKRKAHLSSLIISNQTSRDDALAILKNPELEPTGERILTNQVARKLGLTGDELEHFSRIPEVDETLFSNDQWIYSKRLTKLGQMLIPRDNQTFTSIDIAR